MTEEEKKFDIDLCLACSALPISPLNAFEAFFDFGIKISNSPKKSGVISSITEPNTPLAIISWQ